MNEIITTDILMDYRKRIEKPHLTIMEFKEVGREFRDRFGIEKDRDAINLLTGKDFSKVAELMKNINERKEKANENQSIES